MDRFHFFLKRSFRYENDDEKTKNETIVFKNDRFLIEIVLKKRSFSKRSFLRMILFKNDRFQKHSFLKS